MEKRQEQQARRSSSSPSGLDGELTSIGFARLARSLSEVAAAVGAAPVTFRSPGRVGAGRAIRRNADGSATVAVRYRGRPAVAVAADMIEGIVQAAGKPAIGAAERDRLWGAAGEVLTGDCEQPGGDGGTRSGQVRHAA